MKSKSAQHFFLHMIQIDFRDLVQNLKKSKHLMLTIIYGIVFCLTLLSLLGCQPKDELSSTKSNLGMNDKEHLQLLSVSVEESFESLVLAKAILNNEYAQLNHLSIVPHDGTGRITSETAQISNPTAFLIKTTDTKDVKVSGNFSFEKQVNHIIQSFKKDESGRLMHLYLTKNNFSKIENKGFNKTAAQPVDFSQTVVAEDILIEEISATNKYRVSVRKTSDTSSFKDKYSQVLQNFTYEIQWNGRAESLDQAIPVTKLNMMIERKVAKLGRMTISDDQPQLTVTLGAQCVSLDGQFSYSRGKGKQTVMTSVLMNQSNFQITQAGKVFNSDAKPCESRPVVDLTRLLD